MTKDTKLRNSENVFTVDKSHESWDFVPVTNSHTGIKIGGKGEVRLSQTDAARTLRVSREHLNRVLHGKWKSPSLLARYNDLITVHQQSPNPTPHDHD